MSYMEAIRVVSFQHYEALNGMCSVELVPPLNEGVLKMYLLAYCSTGGTVIRDGSWMLRPLSWLLVIYSKQSKFDYNLQLVTVCRL